jgi:ABC-type uncharacterized transport system substrate-binding protein
MRRRDFIAGLGGAAALPLAARAQQSPVVGWLISRSSADAAHLAEAFRQGLRENGLIDGATVKIEYRWADGDFRRLPAMARELVQLPVTVLAAVGGPPSVVAAKAATSSIPLVFAMSADPISMGLAASFNKPGGNATGVHIFNTQLEPKRLGLMHDLLPQTKTVGVLVHAESITVENQLKDLHTASQQVGLQLRIFRITNDRDIDLAFETLAREKLNALIMAASPFFDPRAGKVATLAEHYRIASIFQFREYVAAGGLMSYGVDISETHRQVGRYVGQIIKGAKPADLPIVVPSKFEFVINLKTAKAIGLTVPATLLARADEVIE